MGWLFFHPRTLKYLSEFISCYEPDFSVALRINLAILDHVGYTQMSSFVKLVLRCFIFSSHERKSLASIMIPQLEGHGLRCRDWPMGMRRRVKITGIC